MWFSVSNFTLKSAVVCRRAARSLMMVLRYNVRFSCRTIIVCSTSSRVCFFLLIFSRFSKIFCISVMSDVISNRLLVIDFTLGREVVYGFFGFLIFVSCRLRMWIFQVVTSGKVRVQYLQPYRSFFGFVRSITWMVSSLCLLPA